MVSTTAANKVDRTEKLGITLPIALLQKLERENAAIYPEANSFEELLKVI
jgi:hypothetical protein